MKPPGRLLDSKIVSLADVDRRRSRWGHRIAYWIGRREFAHFHDGRELDIRITRSSLKQIGEIGVDPRIRLRRGPSDWIGFVLGNRRDVDAAFRLVKMAWRNNRMARS